MFDLDANPWIWLIIGSACLLTGMAVGGALVRRARVRRLAGLARRGRRGERHGRRLLEARGFEILAAGAEREAGLRVDGHWRTFRVRADYLVRRRGRTGLVEVKTGARAPDPDDRHTRRQLREYGQVFDVDQVFLLDASQDRLMRITFPRTKGGSRVWSFAAGAALGLLLAWAVGRWWL